MENTEILKKIQAYANEEVKKVSIQREAELSFVYSEELEDKTLNVFCLGADMPNLIYRVFHVDSEGNVLEERNMQDAAKLTAHFNRDIKPTLKLVPPAIEETFEYQILVENRSEGRPVEIKLRSSVGRDITMYEIYRYFDYKTKVFFVNLAGLSFPGQYLFSVTPDSKGLRLVISNNETIRSRVAMMNELLRNRLLPSYRSIDDAAKILSGKAKANVTLNDREGKQIRFTCQFVYDDEETQTRFAFFIADDDAKKGVCMVQDILDNNKLTLPNQWTEEQKKAFDRIQVVMKEKQEEFRKNVTSFFADNLDFRYKAFQDGRLKAPEAEAPEQTK